MNGYHIDFSHWYTNVDSTRLSRAVQRNDISKIERLLSCGADPNARLSFTISRGAADSTMESNHLILEVKQPDAFRVLTAYGMRLYPRIGYSDSDDKAIENKLYQTFIEENPSQELIDVLCEYKLTVYELGSPPFFTDRNIRSAAKDINAFNLWKSQLKDLYRTPSPQQKKLPEINDSCAIDYLAGILHEDPTNRKALYLYGKKQLTKCKSSPTDKLSRDAFVALSTLNEYVHANDFPDVKPLLDQAEKYYAQFHKTPWIIKQPE